MSFVICKVMGDDVDGPIESVDDVAHAGRPESREELCLSTIVNFVLKLSQTTSRHDSSTFDIEYLAIIYLRPVL